MTSYSNYLGSKRCCSINTLKLGPHGPQGPQGATGPQGPSGGPQGATGLQGATGGSTYGITSGAGGSGLVVIKYPVSI